MEVSLINQEAIKLDINLKNKSEVLKDVADIAVIIGAGHNKEEILNALWERENILPTAVGKSIAIPHCKSSAIDDSRVVFYRLSNPIIWDEDEMVDLVFAILTTNGNDNKHLDLLSRLSRNMLREEFLKMLKESNDSKQIYERIKIILGGK